MNSGPRQKMLRKQFDYLISYFFPAADNVYEIREKEEHMMQN